MAQKSDKKITKMRLKGSHNSTMQLYCKVYDLKKKSNYNFNLRTTTLKKAQNVQ